MEQFRVFLHFGILYCPVPENVDAQQVLLSKMKNMHLIRFFAKHVKYFKGIVQPKT